MQHLKTITHLNLNFIFYFGILTYFEFTFKCLTQIKNKLILLLDTFKCDKSKIAYATLIFIYSITIYHL